LRDKFLGIRGTVEKTEIRMAMELCVPDHGSRIVTLIEHMFVAIPHRGGWVATHRTPVSTLDSQQTPSEIDHNVEVEEGKAGPRVLVVDDEESITELVSMALRYEGFEVQTASSGYGALEQIDAFRPDLILLDVMLPDIDGFNIAERLRRDRRDIPVLFLTARDATEDKVRGLTIGGDDYVTKPFSVAELVARTQAILRRVGKGGPTRELLQLADLEMDDDAHEVRRAGQLVDLTATEYRLLRYLLSNPRRVLTRSQLLDHVWNYDFGGDAGVLETYVSYLRKKVDFTEPHLIHTVRGVGYVLRPPRS
jgi:two-component system OmpR family response regulator